VNEAQPNWRRVALLTAIGFLLVFIAFELWTAFTIRHWADALDQDRQIYADAARRWLAGGSFYLPRQLGGPYEVQVGDVLYPPTAVYFFAVLSFVPILWYVIPIGLLLAILRDWHPSLWAWPLMVAAVAYPESLALLRSGNPSLWLVAAVAAGLRWRWPAAFVLLKPSVFPFALVGIRSRGWWLTVALLAVLTLPLLPMIPDWLHAVSDSRGYGGLGYSVHDVPLLTLPLWAWLARRRRYCVVEAETAGGGAGQPSSIAP
jgi:hypothetical protein